MLVLFFFLLPFDKPPAPERQEVVPKPNHDPTNIEELYQAYRYFGLPLPPKGSFLAKKTRPHPAAIIGGKVVIHLQDVYFLVNTDDPKFEKLKKYRITPTSTALKSNRTIPHNMMLNNWNNQYAWLIFAAQAHHLGWTEAANYGIEEGLKASDDEIEITPILNFLKKTAWEYHKQRLFETTANRRVIQAELKKTFNESEPLFYERQKLLDHNLTLTIPRKWNRNGSAEGLINGLVTGESTPSDLFALGFDAVPALIQHITDERLTKINTPDPSMNTDSGYDYSVSAICKSILSQFSAGETDRFENCENLNFSTSEYLVSQARQSEEWYREAKLIGEEKWCLNHLFEHSAERRIIFIHEGVLKLIQIRHPQLFETIVEKCLVHKLFPQSLLKSIVTSRIPKKDKDRFVRKAMTLTPAEKWLNIVDAYSCYDVEQSRIQLRHYFKEIAAKKTTLIDNKNNDSKSLLSLLDELNDSESWQLFRTCLPNFDVNTRRSMTDYRFHKYKSHSDENLSIKNQCERLKCILTLINDDSQIPIDPNQFPGFVYGNGYRELKIGDLAALKIAEELDFEIPWELERTQDEWKTVRADAKVKAEKAIKKKE